MTGTAGRERLKREAEFHDKTFGEETRRQADKFYAVTTASKNFYRAFLRDHCEGRAILEYGCGPHSHGTILLPRGARLVAGIDISHVAAVLHHDISLKRDLPSLHSCVMNAESLAFNASSFGVICGTGILHHLDLESSFREIARVLTADGKAIFIEPLGHNPVINLYRNRTPEMRSADEHPLLMSDLDLARRFFGRVDVRYFHLSSLGAVLFHRMRWFASLVTLLDGFDRLLFRCLPFLRKHAWAAVLVLSEPRESPLPAAR